MLDPNFKRKYSIKMGPLPDSVILTEFHTFEGKEYERTYFFNINSIINREYHKYFNGGSNILKLEISPVDISPLKSNKKCMKCKGPSETTYCKTCWDEMYSIPKCEPNFDVDDYGGIVCFNCNRSNREMKQVAKVTAGSVFYAECQCGKIYCPKEGKF